MDIAVVKRDQQDPRISSGRCSGGMRGKGRFARAGWTVQVAERMKLPHLHNGLYTWTLVIRITRARSAARFAAARSHAAHVPGWILHVWPEATLREWRQTGVSFPVTAQVHLEMQRVTSYRENSLLLFPLSFSLPSLSPSLSLSLFLSFSYICRSDRRIS